MSAPVKVHWTESWKIVGYHPRMASDGFDSHAVIRAMTRAQSRAMAVRAIWASAMAGTRVPYGAAAVAFPDASARVYMVRVIRSAAARRGALPAMPATDASCDLRGLHGRRCVLSISELFSLCDVLRIAADLSDNRQERTGCHAYRGVAHAELLRRATK